MQIERVSKDSRGGSRTAAICKMERFVVIVNGWKLLTIITKCSILDVAVALDPPLDRLLESVEMIHQTPRYCVRYHQLLI